MTKRLILRTTRKRFAALSALLAITLLLPIQIARNAIEKQSNGLTFDNIEEIDPVNVGLVLGCSRYLSDGRPNLFFKYRIEQAAKLFHLGKVNFLLVSGDNHKIGYNEPQAMKSALVELNVPTDRIVCDYAGFSTLDSVIRAKEIFGQHEIIVVSQEFHNRRAIFIAKENGLKIKGINAKEVDAYNSFKTKFREEFAKVKTVIDIWILKRNPRFLGEPIILAKN